MSSEGERHPHSQQQQHPHGSNGGGAVEGQGSGGGDIMKSSITDSTSSSNSSGNGYLASTSSSSASSTTSSGNDSSSALTTTATSTSTGTTNTAIKVEEPCISDDPIVSNEEKSNTMTSDSSTDTFHTPSASMQNLAGTLSSSRLNGSSSRKRSDAHIPESHEERLEEEDEAAISDSGAPSTSLNVMEVDDKPSPTKSGSEPSSDGAGAGDNRQQEEQQQNQNQSKSSADSSHRQKRKRNNGRDQKQHKRQGSAGSQCSVSSTPDTSQFKTAADNQSSDSDVSRTSGNGSGFEICNEGVWPPTSGPVASYGQGGGSDGGKEENEPDRKSLQSEYSQSGADLNTSVESVDFGTPGERSPCSVAKSYSPLMSSTEIISGSGSASPPQLHSGGSKPRQKKKMWYQQIFSTSYKTRSGDFKKIFKDLPPKERLIVDYSCALQKEILLQGRMYVSQNYVSFYANIFGWETQLSVSFREIESVTKEKTALIIPNAIQISTMSEKFFFSSFVTRDTTYVMLFKLWQRALLEEETMSKKELWRLVHTCYGEELGVTSEDESEEMMNQPWVPATSTVTTIITSSAAGGTHYSTVVDGHGHGLVGVGHGLQMKSISIDRIDPDQVCPGEIGGAIAVGLNIGSSIVTSNGIPISGDQHHQLLLKDANLVPLPVSVLPMTVEPSDSSDVDAEAVLESELRKEIPLPSPTDDIIDEVESGPLPVCPVDHTKGKEMMNAVIPCNIDQLFTMLFTNSTFYLDFQMKRKTTEINVGEWQLGDASQKTRQLTFTVVTGQTIGPKQAQVTETQTLLPASRPGLLYVIQSESVNAGIPYADTFSVNCHYCLTRLSSTESNLVVISKINYKKSTFAKMFIEKNAMSSLAEFFTALEKALKEECAKMQVGGVTPTSPIVVSNLPRRRHPRKKCRAPDIPTVATLTRAGLEAGIAHPGSLGRGATLPGAGHGLGIASETMTEGGDGMEGGLVMKVILAVLGLLLLLNGFLYFKLSSLESAANMSVFYPPTIHIEGEAPQTHQEWLQLLQHQETMHRSEVTGWHEVLVSAIQILHQAEKDLENLKAHISTYGKGDVAIVGRPSSTMADVLSVLGSIQKNSAPTPNESKENAAGKTSNKESATNNGDSEIKS